MLLLLDVDLPLLKYVLLLLQADDHGEGGRHLRALLPAARVSSVRAALERHRVLQRLRLLLGTCIVIVFSAVSGLELSLDNEQLEHILLPVTCAILVGLFTLQHYGTHRVGFLFAPIVCM